MGYAAANSFSGAAAGVGAGDGYIALVFSPLSVK